MINQNKQMLKSSVVGGCGEVLGNVNGFESFVSNINKSVASPHKNLPVVAERVGPVAAHPQTDRKTKLGQIITVEEGNVMDCMNNAMKASPYSFYDLVENHICDLYAARAFVTALHAFGYEIKERNT